MDVVDFIRARLDERAEALSDLANRRAAEAIPAIEMQMQHAMQIAASFPHHGMSHFEFEAWQELARGIEVKRRIVDRYETLLSEDVPADALKIVVGLLASEWPTHPDYRPEWTV